LEQSVVDGDTDRSDWFIEQDGGFRNIALLKAFEIDDVETYSHLATGELDDPEMLELGAYTPEKDNEVLRLVMTVLENRQAVFSRACTTKNSGLFCIYLTGLQEDVSYVEYGSIIDVLFKRHYMDVRLLLANEEDHEIVKEDVDPTFSRTKEEYTRTLAAAIEVLRGRGTSEEYLNDFYGKYSEPEQQKAPFSSTLVYGNAHVSRVVDHLGQLKLRQQTEVRFSGLALNSTARYITREVGYTMPREYCEKFKKCWSSREDGCKS